MTVEAIGHVLGCRFCFFFMILLLDFGNVIVFDCCYL